MNQPQPAPTKKESPTPEAVTPLPEILDAPYLQEALKQAQRFHRLLSKRNDADAFPTPVFTMRLLSAVIIQELGAKASPPAPTPLEKAVEKAKASPPAPALPPPLTKEQRDVYDKVIDLLTLRQRITHQMLANACGFKSHNSAKKHVDNLIDLGYLQRVGKQQVIVLTELRP